ncbi:heme exporter protein CcmB [Thermopetrobacter sp. TC1]|uniref:heme exporter protein CcmB n=1 Tax=Thermopetrobacter sp. TC1 TaxID=1495045 RepID=UPI00056F6BFA|nr:heme exporter protein CcmB [Thermopetrobacter sp. TC1]
MLSPFLSVIGRDVKLAFRAGGGIGTAFGFFLTVVVLLPIGIGPDQALLQRIAPGALWIALLMSVLLSADRIYTADYEDGSLEVMAIGPAPLEVVALAKALAHWLTAGLPLAIAAPLLGFLLNLRADLVPGLLLSMITGSLALSMLAALGAAVTVGLRKGGLLISLLILPLYIPLMIFGVTASTGGQAGPDISTSSYLILAAVVLLSVVVSPVASAAALRAHMR